MKKISIDEKAERSKEYQQVDVTNISDAAKIAQVRRTLQVLNKGNDIGILDELGILRNIEYQIKMGLLEYKE